MKPGVLLTEVSIGDSITNDELLALECDVLIPAAMENAIDATNAARCGRRWWWRRPTIR